MHDQVQFNLAKDQARPESFEELLDPRALGWALLEEWPGLFLLFERGGEFRAGLSTELQRRVNRLMRGHALEDGLVVTLEAALLVDRPLSERRAVLEILLAGALQALRVSPLLQATAEQILEEVRRLGLEGVVGKRLDSRYEPGERSGAWIKLRVNLEQEFVIGGYIPGPRGFDALLVGIYEKKELIFVAKVKNGFVPRVRDAIFPTLNALQTTKCPFANLLETRASRWSEIITAEKMDQCRWVKPKLVFVEWTDAGCLRILRP